MNKTSIEWTHRPQTGGAAGGFTWNPIRAITGEVDHRTGSSLRKGTFCTRISPGCTHCYASVINKRFGNGLEYTVPNLAKIEFYLDDKILAQPSRRKKAATIFVGDMFDLFHEAIPDAMIASVLAVCCKLPRHTFLILTKRAARMRTIVTEAWRQWSVPIPPKHIWFGASIEDQPRADQRVPELLQTPAAVRFLSVEPQLEEIDLYRSGFTLLDRVKSPSGKEWPGVDWVICGGESGPGARMFRREWGMSLLAQCREAGVPFFMKQMGSYPVLDPRYDQTLPGATRKLRDRKGGDPEEWPESLRVREWPQ